MRILGLMSGTSLDGLDLALCEFTTEHEKVDFKIVKAKTIDYSLEWKHLLKEAKNLSAEKYFALHAAYGHFLASMANQLINENNLKLDAIASHGHTIFHQPHLGFSTQLGCGATIAANTGITTVCDFRSLDVALQGQGAPLVPIGDRLLFGDYKACLNIGGIANLSYEEKENRLAYDICEANMLLNYLSEKLGKPYDAGGEMARRGAVNRDLLNQLNNLPFYSIKTAKSLGREWFEKEVLLLMQTAQLKTEDLLASSVEHLADIISNELNEKKLHNVLVTGGGAFNTFLIERIQSKTTCEIILPSKEIINFKEALIFAFLGYLRLNEKNNTLKTVTAAKRNSIGGAVYLGKSA